MSSKTSKKHHSLLDSMTPAKRMIARSSQYTH
jgi:hypothetical protein